MRILLAKSKLLIAQYFDALFDNGAESTKPWLSIAWLGALLLLGVLLWGKFFNWGNIPFDFHDWAEVNAARLAFLKDSVHTGLLPLHMPDASALRNITDRYMSLPDVILSPQVLLMRWLDEGPFVLVNTLLFYFLGFLGLLWFRRKYSLSLFSFTILFFLFNFNGHILTHLSVGHVTWNGYFLFPWVVALVLRLLEGDHSWMWVGKVSFLLFFMYINGSFHQFVWVLLFLGFLALSNMQHFWQVIKAGFFSVLLSTFRLLPPVLHLKEFDNEFLGGYPTLMDVLNAFVQIRFPEESLQYRNMFSSLGWWEYSVYIGLAGFLFIVVFGIILWTRQKDRSLGYPALLLPTLGVALLSLGQIYRIMRLIPIPLLSGERASIRMIALPFVVITIIAALQFQKWLGARKPGVVERIAWLGISGIIFHDLWQHLKAWQVTNAYHAFPNTPVNLAIKVVSNHPDPAYFSILWIGLIVSLFGMLLLSGLIYLEKNNTNKAK